MHQDLRLGLKRRNRGLGLMDPCIRLADVQVRLLTGLKSTVRELLGLARDVETLSGDLKPRLGGPEAGIVAGDRRCQADQETSPCLDCRSDSGLCGFAPALGLAEQVELPGGVEAELVIGIDAKLRRWRGKIDRLRLASAFELPSDTVLRQVGCGRNTPRILRRPNALPSDLQIIVAVDRLLDQTAKNRIVEALPPESKCLRRVGGTLTSGPIRRDSGLR